MIEIFTASWFSKLPDGMFRVSISRSAPRGTPGGWRAYKPLMPGPWFKTASEEEYLNRYRDEVLGLLDPTDVVADLAKLSGGAPVAMLCYEQAARINRGELYCHRHLAATWLEQRLGIEVPEYGFEGQFDRFGRIRACSLPEPSYRKP